MHLRLFAEQILDLCNEVDDLRMENARLRKVEQEFHDYVVADFEAGERQMAGWLDLLLTKRIVDRE